MDYDAALEKVRAQEHRVRQWNRARRGAVSPAPTESLFEIEQQMGRALPQLIEIAKAAGMPLLQLTPRDGVNGTVWTTTLPALAILAGYFETAEETSRIVGPRGPSLRADQFHPWVWGAAAGLWSDGHYAEAVRSAAIQLESRTRAKVGTRQMGEDLFNAFGLGDSSERHPRLRFDDVAPETDDWKNRHEGAQWLGRAVMRLIRNPLAHDGEPDITESEALEMLAIVSMAARLVDEASVALANPDLN